MNPAGCNAGKPRVPRSLTCAWLFLTALCAHGQLAITEVMSSASGVCGGTNSIGNADFWELTNFGSVPVNLRGYIFSDRDKLFPGTDEPWRIPDISIAPAESVIFLRSQSGTRDALAFRNWWGNRNLPSNLQIIFYPKNYGFSSTIDGVRLWDPQTNLVDEVQFGEAVRGSSFTYSSVNGEFGEVTRLGTISAFRAEECDDIGSPGFTAGGAVPITISEQPVPLQSVDPGGETMISITASGLPRPRYQWFFNGTVITGAIWPIFRIPITRPEHDGDYYVELDNGLEKVRSANSRLAVNTTPIPPQLYCGVPQLCSQSGACPPFDTVVTLNQTAVFYADVRGFPLPAMQWSWSVDGSTFSPITGATNRTLEVPNVSLANTGFYRITASNSLGVAGATATLALQEKPRLRITEALPLNCGTTDVDWWELTNIGGQPVNLCGYRWDDSPGNIGGGPTITNEIIIEPGESVIFLQQKIDPAAFITLWGAVNLPAKIKIIQFSANSLLEDGDEITIWNPTATEDSDFIDSVVFSTAPLGASLWFDREICAESEFGLPSIPGQGGAFRSARDCDVGSPGWTRWTQPRFLNVQREASGVRLQWEAQPGSRIRIEHAQSLHQADTVWELVGDFSALNSRNDTLTPHNNDKGFYRILKLTSPEAPCFQ